MTDDRLDKVKAWIAKDSAGVFAPMWQEIVASLDRITIREMMVHGTTELLPERTLPIICIGDSLWNCGLGGGGILAMHDALDLTDALLNPAAGLIDPDTGKINWDAPKLVEVEAEMLKRKAEFNKQQGPSRERFLRREPGKVGTRFEWEDMMPGTSVASVAMRSAAALVLPRVCALFQDWYAQDAARGTAGSDETSPMFPAVEEALKREAALDGGVPPSKL